MENLETMLIKDISQKNSSINNEVIGSNDWFKENKPILKNLVGSFFDNENEVRAAHCNYKLTTQNNERCYFYRLRERDKYEPGESDSFYDPYTRYFGEVYETALKNGKIYNGINHTIPVNLSWVLGILHKKKEIIVKSFPTERNIDSKKGIYFYTAFAYEIASLLNKNRYSICFEEDSGFIKIILRPNEYDPKTISLFEIMEIAYPIKNNEYTEHEKNKTIVKNIIDNLRLKLLQDKILKQLDLINSNIIFGDIDSAKNYFNNLKLCFSNIVDYSILNKNTLDWYDKYYDKDGCFINEIKNMYLQVIWDSINKHIEWLCKEKSINLFENQEDECYHGLCFRLPESMVYALDRLFEAVTIALNKKISLSI